MAVVSCDVNKRRVCRHFLAIGGRPMNGPVVQVLCLSATIAFVQSELVYCTPKGFCSVSTVSLDTMRCFWISAWNESRARIFHFISHKFRS